ncbi:MAG: hypothetical protein CMP23_13575 [Rickettsiales bacterium]|nr:hypothetical protein [Rickettsiales bacterium]
MRARIYSLPLRKNLNMSCPDEERLLLFAEGAEDMDLEAHLESCPNCTKQIATLKLQLAEWRSSDLLDHSRFDDDYFAKLGDQVVAAMEQNEDQARGLRRGPERWWRNRLAISAALAAAAMLLLALQLGDSPTLRSTPALVDNHEFEETVREISSAMLSELESDEQIPLAFLTQWQLEQDADEELAPLPLTTSLAEELELLDAQILNSLTLSL